MPLVPSYIESLSPSVAGRSAEEVQRAYSLGRVVKLASNENPLGPSPAAVEAVRGVLGKLHLYPDGGLALRQVLASRVKVENVIAGSVSEGIMSGIIRTFLCHQ